MCIPPENVRWFNQVREGGPSYLLDKYIVYEFRIASKFVLVFLLSHLKDKKTAQKQKISLCYEMIIH